MKKYLYTLLLLIMLEPFSKAENIAIVDLKQIVNSSSQVKQLNNDHAKQVKELEKIIINARGEITNEKDAAKVLLLEEKYTKEFNTKKEALDTKYNRQLLEIEKNIKLKISEIARQASYDYVFAKSVVLYGGHDITNEIISSMR